MSQKRSYKTLMFVNVFAYASHVTKVVVLPVRERGVCEPIKAHLSARRVEDLTDVFKALSDPIRLQIVAALRNAEQQVCVCDCTASFEVSQPTMSHHLAKLREVGLLSGTRRGTWMYYQLRQDLPDGVRRVIDAI